MQQWEYLIVVADLGEGVIWRAWKVNDKELPNWLQGPPLTEYMNKLGCDGWELVGASWAGPSAQTYVGRLFFKRLKA